MPKRVALGSDLASDSQTIGAFMYVFMYVMFYGKGQCCNDYMTLNKCDSQDFFKIARYAHLLKTR